MGRVSRTMRMPTDLAGSEGSTRNVPGLALAGLALALGLELAMSKLYQ